MSLPDSLKIRAVVRYDGTDYAGFQRHPRIPTVGSALERALSRLFHVPTTLVCAGRTDAGVHASGQVIDFLAPPGFPIERLPVALNSIVGNGITLHRPSYVETTFSSRFDARSRHYIYISLNRRDRCALRARYCGHEYHSLDLDRMRAAAALLCGSHDFRSFCGQVPEVGGTVRTVFEIKIMRRGEFVRVDVIGNGFLHRMVRVIVGTLLEIGSGRRDPASIPALLAARDRRVTGLTAEASGLYLAGVRYDDFDSFALPPLLEGFDSSGDS